MHVRVPAQEVPAGLDDRHHPRLQVALAGGGDHELAHHLPSGPAGLYLSGQRAITLPGADGLAKIGDVMSRLRAAPPSRVGALDVLSVSDYQAQRRTEKGGKAAPLALPPSNMLAFDSPAAAGFTARPSGTEPKIKFYFDFREPVPEGRSIAHAQGGAAAKLDELAKAFCALAGVA